MPICFCCILPIPCTNLGKINGIFILKFTLNESVAKPLIENIFETSTLSANVASSTDSKNISSKVIQETIRLSRS